jgi:hypothetical protein
VENESGRRSRRPSTVKLNDRLHEDHRPRLDHDYADLLDDAIPLTWELGRPDSASHIELGFPHDFYDTDMLKRFVQDGLRDRIDE